MFIGLILVALGVVALLAKLDVLSGSIWGYTWPIILIALGLNFLLGWRRRRFWGGRWGSCCGWGPHEEEREVTKQRET